MLKNITRILPFLVVTLLVLGGVELFYQLMERYILRPPARSEQEETGEVLRDQAPSAKVQHQNYQVIVERNLFRSYTEEEQPEPVVEEVPLEGMEETSLDLVLMGTITGPGGISRAIIHNKQENRQDLYYQGDVIEGAEVKDILRGKVILNYQGRDEVLDMSEAASMRPRVTQRPPEPFQPPEPEPPPPQLEEESGEEFIEEVTPDEAAFLENARENTAMGEENFGESGVGNLEPLPLEFDENGGASPPGESAGERPEDPAASQQ